MGQDGSGEAKHAHIRSTNSEGRVFRMNIESSASEHCFHKNGTDKSLYVFEAPIDLLSHITLYPYGWQEHSYVTCCGTSIQPVLERLRQNPKLDTVYLCLDNDDAGNDACDRMTDTLEDMGLEVERLCPVRKDWNDDLRAKFEKRRASHEPGYLDLPRPLRRSAGVLLAASFLSKSYSLDRIKSKTVGDGQHGTARWATPKEIGKTYHTVPFRPRRWRKGKELPTEQGLILGSVGGDKRKAREDLC